MVNPRVYIDVAESSSLTFMEHHAGDAESFFQNESVFISLENNAQFEPYPYSVKFRVHPKYGKYKC